LIIDEISMGLAPELVSQAFQLIARLHGEGRTILLVERQEGPTGGRTGLLVGERGVVLIGTAWSLLERIG